MKAFWVPIMIALFGIAVVFFGVNPQPIRQQITIAGEPTNFLKLGRVEFKNPGQVNSEVNFTYEGPGKIQITKPIVFDELSFCVMPEGSRGCQEFNVTVDQPFNGKRVLLEGIEKDDTILVRKMRRLEVGDQPLLYSPGRIFVSWEKARQLIESCSISMVMQTHSLDVRLTLRDSREVVTVSPVIDDVFPIVQAAGCPDVGVATE